ncbi:right-handed parallel beta-helix repeat-containing protein [Candidatus Bathyarchaeota archaeon]|nr:right-handed parallel beta-helix repeat-containing protein [Candidatus Bathyarchaeota archaeon]
MSKNRAVAFAAIFLIASVSLINQPVEARFLGNIYIKADGSVVGTNSIQRNGDLYILTANISDGIQVQKSSIVIDGAGYTLEGSGQASACGIDLTNGRHQDQSRDEIYNVTVKNMRITHWGHGIDCSINNNNTFIGNYVANCSSTGVQIHGSNNILRNNTLESGVLILYSGINVITENNIIMHGPVPIFVGDECPEQIVDRNYWSDYLTKYPNAKEIDNTGIWNTPYTKDNYGGRSYIDNHPLIEPVPLIEPPLDATPTPTSDGTPTTTHPLLIAAAVVVAIVIVGASLLLYLKKLERKTGSHNSTEQIKNENLSTDFSLSA